MGKPITCGAVLYTIINNEYHIILGYEYHWNSIGKIQGGNWYHFKGKLERGECNEECAIRELYEETFCLIKIDKINLVSYHETKFKKYYIGFVYVEPEFIETFNKKRKKYAKISNSNLLEKIEVKAFPISYFTKCKDIPYTTNIHCQHLIANIRN